MILAHSIFAVVCTILNFKLVFEHVFLYSDPFCQDIFSRYIRWSVGQCVIRL